MPRSTPPFLLRIVALLAEGVDRNAAGAFPGGDHRDVALLAEGVDRNLQKRSALDLFFGRPPRGGRG